MQAQIHSRAVQHICMYVLLVRRNLCLNGANKRIAASAAVNRKIKGRIRTRCFRLFLGAVFLGQRNERGPRGINALKTPDGKEKGWIHSSLSKKKHMLKLSA